MKVNEHAFCIRCGTALAATMLACPNCQTLVYSNELHDIAEEARRAEQEGDGGRARELWMTAMTMLPPDTTQYRTIQAHLQTLEQAVPAVGGHGAVVPAAAARGGVDWKKLGGPAAIAAAVLWKFKGVALLALSKAKFLVFGFSKMSTLVSMFASFGLYLTMFGWRFALGLVLSFYVHEMGHVAAYRRYGIPVSAPMFVPGLGVFVRGQYLAATPEQRARISLAGPLWGLGAALACFAMAAATGSQAWAAIASVGAQINILNLIPLWILDGAGAIENLTRRERFLLCGAAAAIWVATGQGMLFLVAAAMAFRAFRRKGDAGAADWQVTIQYAGLLGALGVMAMVPVDPTK